MDPRLAVTAICSFTEVFALWSLYYKSLVRTLPWFTVYLYFSILQSSIPFLLRTSTDEYRTAYFITMTMVVFLRILVVVELARRLLMQYPGIEVVSRALMAAMTGAALLISATGGLDSLRIWGAPWKVIAYHSLSLLMRYSASSLCVACALIGLFSNYFETGVPRNIIRHAWILTAYLASAAAGTYAMNRWRGHEDFVGILMIGSASGCYAIWGMWLTREGSYGSELTPALPSELIEIDRRRAGAIDSIRTVQYPLSVRLFRSLLDRSGPR